MDFQRELSNGIAEGRVRYREDIVDGLERAKRLHWYVGGKEFREVARARGGFRRVTISRRIAPNIVRLYSELSGTITPDPDIRVFARAREEYTAFMSGR